MTAKDVRFHDNARQRIVAGVSIAGVFIPGLAASLDPPVTIDWRLAADAEDGSSENGRRNAHRQHHCHDDEGCDTARFSTACE